MNIIQAQLKIRPLIKNAFKTTEMRIMSLLLRLKGKWHIIWLSFRRNLSRFAQHCADKIGKRLNFSIEDRGCGTTTWIATAIPSTFKIHHVGSSWMKPFAEVSGQSSLRNRHSLK